MCVLLFLCKCFGIVYSLVERYTVLSGNDVIHYLELSGTLDTMQPFWLHLSIHAYFICTLSEIRHILVHFKNLNLITDSLGELIMKHYCCKSRITGI